MNVSEVQNLLHSPEYNPPRSGKDLSHRKVCTFKVGELLPVLCEEYIPKDYFEIDLATLVRSCMPLNTAAFMRSKIHFDFFNVPMTAVWRNYNKFYTGRDDNFTSYSRGYQYEPNVSLEEIVRFINAGSTTSPVDSQDSRVKLFQLLGYGNWRGISIQDMVSGQYAPIKTKSLTALPLYAYQRIYNLYYRDPYRDEPSGVNDKMSMSADNIDCSSYANSLVTETGNPDLAKMRYHRYPMDLFMGLLPNQQFGTVSQITAGQDLNLRLTSNSQSGVLTPEAVSTTQVYSGHDHRVVYGDSNNVYASQVVPETHPLFDVMSLRRALAVQKYAEYNMRAGWKGSKQMKAMFGVSSSYDWRHDIQQIGSYEFPIMVDEVVQTTPASSTTGGTTSGTQLGELGGKVIGVGNGQKVKFESGDRSGYLMCIAYIVPQVEYDPVGIDKMLVRSVNTDHYNPFFANLGLEPVFKFELNALGNTNVFDSTIGYTTRYHEYKTKVDKVYSEFGSTQSMSPWVTIRRDLAGIINSGQIPLSYLYVSPSIMNKMFVADANSSWITDQFMANMNFSVKAVRAMSDLGLPTA